MTPPGDLLLHWASELGSGGLKEIKQGTWWLMLHSRLDLETGAAGRWLRDMSALGHLEVDWRNRMWSVAPAVLTALPFAGGLGVVCGSRLASLRRRVDQAEAASILRRVDNSVPVSDMPLPQTLIVSYEDQEELQVWAEELQVSYVPCFALQAVDMLPRLAPSVLSPPPQFNRLVEQYDPGSRKYLPVERWTDDGLYRQRGVDGKRICLLHREGEWREVSHERGVYLELQRTQHERAVIRWLPEKAPGRERMGRLVVQWGFPLPDLQRRVAVMCSGIAPRIAPRTSMIIYENVPHEVAKKIATSLDQPLGGPED